MSAEGRERMSPLLGDVGDEGLTTRDVRAMARMCHTGVPVGDVAYIFGVSPRHALRCVWRYARLWVVLDALGHGAGTAWVA